MILKLTTKLTTFQITITERAGDCYYQIEELEKYAVMPVPEDISDIPTLKT